MKFNIYNYNNKPTEVDTEDKEIRYIKVAVVSGNEFINIHYENGIRGYYKSIVPFILIYYEDYIIPKERIQEWIDLEKVTDRTISYYRLEVFEEDEEEWEWR